MLGLLRRRPQLLTERQDALRAQVRDVLATLSDALTRFGADVAPGDARTLDEAIANLEELFMLVIAGEFNSGKSSFINALLGDKVVAEGVTPTTDRITLLRHGDEPDEHTVEEFLMERRFPSEVLRRIVVVDTPGTNAIIRRHEELTREFIPRSDLVLFVTSADRPFTESERAFLEAIREWGKKIVFVLNKVDLLETPAEREQVVSFIRDNVRDLLGFTPQIFPVSARLAKRARADGDEQALAASSFEPMERFILETLDEEERVRLKLLSPLGVARHLTDKYLKAAEVRLATLQQDVAMMENIERQLVLFREDLAADFQLHQTDVENILNEFELRAMRFFDDTIRVTNIPRLVRDQDGIRDEFEKAVVGDLPRQIEDRVQGLIDWMIEKNLRLWQSTTDYLRRERAPEHRSGIIGDIGGSFEYNRAALIESVARRAQQVVASYDREVESQALAEEVRAAVAGSALVGAGAVGLGALLVALLHTAALDFTGVLAAGVLAVGGLYLIPNKRRQVKRQFRERVQDLREQLVSTMRRQFDSELEQMVERIREAVAPYTRFVRSQQAHLVEVQRSLSDVDVDLGRIRAEIGDGQERSA